MLISLRLKHPAKTSEPKYFTEFGILIYSSETQSLKALFPILMTDVGIIISFNDKQFSVLFLFLGLFDKTMMKQKNDDETKTKIII